MSIRDELHDELKDAMRAPDRNRIDVVRQIKTEIGRAVTAPGFKGEADDELYRKTIAAYAKKMGKALAEYESYGDRGAEAAAKLRFEVEYLERWLPKAPSTEEVAAMVVGIAASAGRDVPGTRSIRRSSMRTTGRRTSRGTATPSLTDYYRLFQSLSRPRLPRTQIAHTKPALPGVRHDGGR